MLLFSIDTMLKKRNYFLLLGIQNPIDLILLSNTLIFYDTANYKSKQKKNRTRRLIKYYCKYI